MRGPDLLARRRIQEDLELLVKCVINPKMQVIYAKNVYCSRGANLRPVTARMDDLSKRIRATVTTRLSKFEPYFAPFE